MEARCSPCCDGRGLDDFCTSISPSCITCTDTLGGHVAERRAWDERFTTRYFIMYTQGGSADEHAMCKVCLRRPKRAASHVYMC
jgi:hypothetical protein